VVVYPSRHGEGRGERTERRRRLGATQRRRHLQTPWSQRPPHCSNRLRGPGDSASLALFRLQVSPMFSDHTLSYPRRRRL
jgi:hypothetical protein